MRTGSLFFCYLRAAHSTWGQSLREYMCVDSSAAMLDLAEKLLKGGSESGLPYVPGVFFRQFLPVSPKVQFDVVVSAFSLSELPSKADRNDIVQTLWRKTSHFLILVENGTKAGHSLLMDARDLVLNVRFFLLLSSYPPSPTCSHQFLALP